MVAYTVEARPRVRKAIRQLDPKARNNVLAKMRALASDPRPIGAEALHPQEHVVLNFPDQCV